MLHHVTMSTGPSTNATVRPVVMPLMKYSGEVRRRPFLASPAKKFVI